MNFRRIINYIRFLSFVLCIITITLWICSSFFVSELNHLGETIASKYQSHYLKELKKTEQKLLSNKNISKELLDRFDSDYAKVQFGDVLWEEKRTLIQKMIQKMLDLGKLEEALFWNDKLISAHKRDLIAIKMKVKILALISNNKSEVKQ